MQFSLLYLFVLRTLRQWHPDVCTKPNAHEQSVKIIEAHKILDDPQTRSEYDRLRNYQRRAYSAQDSTAYSTWEEGFARVQETARQQAEEFVQKTLEGLLGMLLSAGRVVWKGESSIRSKNLSFGTRMSIGFKGFVLLLTVILTFTGVAAPVTIPISFVMINSLYHKRHYIGIGNLLSSTLLFTVLPAAVLALIILIVAL